MSIEQAMVWIVGQWRHGAQWEIQGVFTTEAKANAACRNDRYFVAPAVLDEEWPDKTVDWPKAAYYATGARSGQ